jgi:putative transposase
MIHRGYRFKLHPTPEQEEKFFQFAGVCRLIYNIALEQRRDWYRQYERETGSQLNFITQSRQLTVLREEFDFIRDVSQTCEQQVLRDLDQAFQYFFKGTASYPRPRKKGLNDIFRFLGRETQITKLNAKWSLVYLPKIGLVKFRSTRPLQGRLLNTTITHSADGWYVSFCCEIEHEPPQNFKPAIGIDRGVTNNLALSNGELLPLPETIKLLERKQRKAQKALSRKKKGSKRYTKQRKRVAKIYSKAVRIRKDWQHRVTFKLSNEYGVIAIEDLKTSNMTRSAKGSIEEPGKNVKAKAGLNRSILSQGWYSFETMLTYKLEERGGKVIKVDPKYTSQTCSDCGAVNSQSRKNQATYECIECGFTKHADINAAINILRRSTASKLVEKPHERLCETRTRRTPKSSENRLVA